MLRQMTCRLPSELLDALGVAAEGSGVTKAEIVRRALERDLVLTLAALNRTHAPRD
jgi:hypothetical protein